MSVIPTPREPGGPAAPGHEVWFVETGDFLRGECTCGWRGNGRLSRRLAREEAAAHVTGAKPASARGSGSSS